MQRVPEPELMDDPEQARAYAEADFSDANGLFVDCLRRYFPDAQPARVLDLGCGPADIPVRIAQRYPAARIDGLDGSSAMLEHGERLVAKAGLQARINLVHGMLGDTPLLHTGYDAVISNSLLHHLADPMELWSTIRRVSKPGAAVLVMDLLRPESQQALDILLAQYAEDAPPVLRRDFRASLHAAYATDEVTAQLARGLLGDFAVEVVSDRHFAVHGIMSGADDR